MKLNMMVAMMIVVVCKFKLGVLTKFYEQQATTTNNRQ